MALDLTTKYKIVSALGYPPGVIISGNVNFTRWIYDRLNALPTELEATVTGLLTRLESLETQLSSALSRAGVKRIDDIELDTGNSTGLLRSEKAKVLRELGGYFDIGLGPYAAGGSMGNVRI